MSDFPPVRFGILGCGRISANAFAPALARATGATLVAAASRDPARARTLAPRAHSSYEALLDDPEVEAVYVATHNGLHLELVQAAFERGLHVLSEKPLGCDAGECEAMLESSRRAGRTLAEAFMYRYHPQVSRLLERLRQGAIGDLRTVEASFSFKMNKGDDVRLRPEWGGGSLLDVGCYCVNACRQVLGHQPRAVRAMAWMDPVHGVDLALHGVLDYGEGRFGVVSCGFDGGLRNRVLLSGTEGVLELPQAFVTWQEPPVLRLHRDGRCEETRFPPVDVYQLEIEDFARAVRGAGAPLLAPDEGLHNARVMDALRTAARAG